MSLTRKVAHNTGIQIIGKTTSNFLGVVAVALMTRSLGTEGFGAYTAIVSFLQFFAALADGGLNALSGQMLGEISDSDPEASAKKSQLISTMMYLRVIMAVILYVLAIGLSFLFPYDATVRSGIAFMTIGFFFISGMQLLTSIFQRELATMQTMVAENISRVVFLAGVALVMWYGGGLMAMLAAAILGHIVNFVWLFWQAKRLMKISFVYDATLFPIIWQRTWPLGLGLLFNLIYWKADSIIMSWTRPMSEVGLYGAAYRVLEVTVQLPLMFSALILPILSGAWALNNKEKFSRMMQKSFDLVVLAGVPLFVGTLFLSKDIMLLLAGKDFAGSSAPLRVLMLANLMIFVGSLLTHAVVAIQAQRYMVIFYGITAFVTIIGYWLLIPKYGMMAAAWFTVISEIMIVLGAMWSMKVKAGFVIRWQGVGRTILASLVLAGFLWLAQGINFWIQLIGAMAVYGVAALVFKAIEPGIVREVLSKQTEQV